MASPQTAGWWSTFLTTHGSDSEEESAFLGYLSTQGVSALDADSAELEAAYAAFVTYMSESATRGADPGPSRAELAAQQGVAESEKQFVAKSRMSMPGQEKPMDAATRPAETKEAPPESAPKAETAQTEVSASESGSSSRLGRRGSES